MTASILANDRIKTALDTFDGSIAGDVGVGSVQEKTNGKLSYSIVQHQWIEFNFNGQFLEKKKLLFLVACFDGPLTWAE